MARATRLGETPFAVVDLETTGVYAGGHDRIIEIAVVRLRPDLAVEDEWVTLVNPARDIGRTDVHGIRAGDVLDAPRFDEIAGDAAAQLHDAVLVGHQLRFDRGFLASEFSRVGVALPPLPGQAGSMCQEIQEDEEVDRGYARGDHHPGAPRTCGRAGDRSAGDGRTQ